LRVKMAARAKKTNASGDERPDAELGAEVEEEEPVAEVVFDPVEPILLVSIPFQSSIVQGAYLIQRGWSWKQRSWSLSRWWLWR
jgi:hypothetical protein